MSTKKDKRKTSKNDEIIASFEISDGNCLKQIVEYFKSTVSTIPLAFYRDRMVIIRGNVERTIVNEAIFDNTDFIINYTTNPELFNDPSNIKEEKQKVKVIENGVTKYIEETVEVPDPRHIYIPITDIFHKHVKTISRRDGFRITIYKYADDNTETEKGKQKGRNINTWIPDSYMKAAKISANSAPYGEVKIDSENIEEYQDYNFDFDKPMGKFPNQKIKLSEMSTTCTNFVRLRYDAATLMVYPRGFRMMGEEGKSDQDYGWGVYADPKVSKGKIKIIIKDPDTEYDSFGVPLDLLKAVSKLQTVAGNGGVVAIRSNEHAMEMAMPISTAGRLKITIVPPILDEEEENTSQHEEEEEEDEEDDE
jgi:hypothetical protein